MYVLHKMRCIVDIGLYIRGMLSIFSPELISCFLVIPDHGCRRLVVNFTSLW